MVFPLSLKLIAPDFEHYAEGAIGEEIENIIKFETKHFAYGISMNPLHLPKLCKTIFAKETILLFLKKTIYNTK